MKYGILVAIVVVFVAAAGALFYMHERNQALLRESMRLQTQREYQERLDALRADNERKIREAETAEAKRLEEARQRAAEEAREQERKRIAAEEARKRAEEAARKATEATVADDEEAARRKLLEKDRLATESLLRKKAYSDLSRSIARDQMIIRQLQAQIDNRFYYETVKSTKTCPSCGGRGQIDRGYNSYPRYILCQDCGGRGTVETTSQVRRERDVRQAQARLRAVTQGLTAKTQQLKELAKGL
jgi:hypothetical protein